MTIVVNGATGNLGRLTVESLLAKGVAAADIVAAGRNTRALAELANSGVRTAVIDYGDRETLREAFAGADVVLLISGNEPGRRVQQHANAVQVAKEVGNGHLVYTSVTKASTTAWLMAPDHKATEEIIAESGVPSTILRNGVYTENYLAVVEQARATGVVVAAIGDGRVARASRRDYADAAAVVLTQGGRHVGKVYELSGDVAWNFHELAATIGDIVGREVVYTPVSPEAYLPMLVEYGLDPGMAGFIVALDGQTSAGLSAQTPGELSELIGRPTTPHYGSISHNVKAIYQRYLGWYDANPARLWQHPPKAAAEPYVAFMGGAGAVVDRASESVREGDLRWAAQVLDHVVFAEPDHADGRELLADVLEQLGFGSENGTWRAPTCPGRWNCGPAISGPTVTTSADILGQLIPELFFDAVAIQVNGPAAWDLDLTIRWDFPDHGGAYRTTLHNGVFSYVRDESGQVQVTVTVPSAALGPLAVGDVSGATAAGLTLDGDGTALERLLSVVQPGDIAFNIVEP